MPRLTLHGLEGYYTLHLHNALVVQNHPRFNCVRACTEFTWPNYRTPPEIEPARAQLWTVRVMLNAGLPALLDALSFFLTTNLSGSIFGNVLGALQTLARSLPTSRDALQSRTPFCPPTRLPLRCATPSHLRISRATL
ncbi:hypothetical protein BGY98DRAFT_1025240 [Russula aff. rugulosa BPL654]|nr:hypothetical protein BGY98DRAFT_1025240 [Russula aff. rugulosa BPL654]